VPGEFYFMAVGGLGVSLAGFAGLIAALEGRESLRAPIAGWRIRQVVYQGFGVTFVGFATVALYTVTGNVALTVRLATIGAVLAIAANWRSVLPSPAWPDERQRRFTIFAQVVFSAAALVNLALADIGYLQLVLLVLLFRPASTFMLAVADVTRGGAPASADTGPIHGVADGEPPEA
jgi:hypothetical protein